MYAQAWRPYIDCGRTSPEFGEGTCAPLQHDANILSQPKGLRRFINHGPFLNIPLILETPKKKKSDDPENIAKIRKMMNAQ